MSKQTAQIIDPKAASPQPLNLKPPLFDEGALARAEAALRGMSASFQPWLEEEVAKVQDARLAAAQTGWSHDALARLLSAAHDVKGLGGTYDYPLVTQIAASLCRLIETESGKAAAGRDSSLTEAHVDALRAAVRDQIKTDADPVGRTLLRALEARVEALGVAPPR